MKSESISNPNIGVCSVWPHKGICQFGHVILWDTINMLCLHEACFLYFSIFFGGEIIVIFNIGYGESF